MSRSESETLECLQFSVDTFPSTFAKSAQGLVTGEISARLGDRAFPDAQWNDFVVVIMSWWLEEMREFLTGIAATVNCRFMDGPYWFVIGHATEHTLMVSFMEERKGTKCIVEGFITRESALSAMLSAGDSVIR
jgi:hypothetical protein